MLAAAVLTGASAPVLVRIMGVWTAFSLFLLLATGLAWFASKQASEPMSDGEVSRVFQPQRAQVGESGIQPEAAWETGRELLLAYEEAAADRNHLHRSDAREVDFLPDSPPVPALPVRDRQAAIAEEEEDEGDQIIYVFDDEPSLPSEQQESSREAVKTDLLLAEEHEWEFAKDNG